MKFTASQIAAITGGRVVGNDQAVCDGASIDTRTIGSGELFIPIIDARDGHDFIPVAVAAGCSVYLTQRQQTTVEAAATQGATAVVVDDTGRALTELGKTARRLHEGPVIGITGSVGKTSVKDLLYAALAPSRRTHASERSFNNELGVPLTLVNAPDDAEVLIVEMGARGLGHIAELCEIAKPTVGVVTWVGAVHTSEFGSIEVVARAKAELIAALASNGRSVLNAECAEVLAMKQGSPAPTMTYGVEGKLPAGVSADITAIGVSVDEQLRPTFQVSSFGRPYRASLPVHGVHQVSNALAAITAAEAVGVSTGAAIAGLAKATISPWRMELTRTPTGATVINDAYNANAISTAAALRSLAALDAERRVAVLGVMAELGSRHDDDHREMAELCSSLGIELLAFQEPAYGVEPVADFDEAVARLGQLGSRDAVLIKGSRVAELEGLAGRLLA